MQAHGLHITDASRKSRATSCTECRQVKLKCDLREKYPSPCSRCHRNKLDCRTDASFKRVPARSRIKYLENEISHLKRARTLEQATSAHQPESSAGGSGGGGRQNGTTDLSPQHLSDHEHVLAIRSSVSSSSDRGGIPAMRPLLILKRSEPRTPFMLSNIVVPYEDALTLIQTFEVAFYPHFACLEQIESLWGLHDQSKLLFWTIVTLSSAHHVSRSHYFSQLHEPHAQLLDQVCRGALAELTDLQAVLIMCEYPNFRKGLVLRNSSWHLLGSVMFSARQMGIDRECQEVFLGIQQNLDSLRQHSHYSRRMTWLKCFESDVLWSAWYGHLPTLILPGQLDRIVGFCKDPVIPREYAGIIELLVEMTRHTVALSEGLMAAPSAMMIRAANRDLEAVRARYSSSWSVKSELYYLSTRNNLYMTALVLLHVADPTREEQNTSTLLYSEIITAARSSAVQFAGLATDLGKEILDSPMFATLSPEAQPFGGWPKVFNQMYYYAGCVMIKYLDSPLDAKADDIEATRNSYGRMYQLYVNSAKTEENLAMAAAFEVAGRALVNNSCQLRTRVTSRLAASLYYNVSWMAIRLRDPTSHSDVDDEDGNDEEPKESKIKRLTPRPSSPIRDASMGSQPTNQPQMQSNIVSIPLTPAANHMPAQSHPRVLASQPQPQPQSQSCQPQQHQHQNQHQQPPPPPLPLPQQIVRPAHTQQQPPITDMATMMQHTPMDMNDPHLQVYAKPTQWDPQAPGIHPSEPFPFGNWNNALYDSFFATVQPEDSPYRFAPWNVHPS